MRKISYKLTLAAGAALLAFGTSALAVSDHANAHSGKTDPSASASPRVHGKGSGKLADAKLKACQKRQTAVGNIMTRIVDRATKQLVVFDKIATRTEAFYDSKGRTLSNYDALVSAVDAAKAKAQTDLAAMKTTDTFKCDGTDPKGSASSFKDNLRLEIADLKAYKTAVKNLIVGVKSANKGTGTDSDESESPKPSASASASPSASPTATPSPANSPTTTPEPN